METDFLPGNILKFNFKNIMLPDDKSDELGSHGFVTYKATIKDGFAIGNEIQNTAYIYFDFNPAIITNTAKNRLAAPTGINQTSKGKFSLTAYPNPANTQLSVQLNKSEVGGEIKVIDLLGHSVIRKTIESSLSILNTANLPSGIYVVQINKGLESQSIRILINH
jgi:hypothetical protein